MNCGRFSGEDEIRTLLYILLDINLLQKYRLSGPRFCSQFCSHFSKSLISWLFASCQIASSSVKKNVR